MWYYFEDYAIFKGWSLGGKGKSLGMDLQRLNVPLCFWCYHQTEILHPALSSFRDQNSSEIMNQNKSLSFSVAPDPVLRVAPSGTTKHLLQPPLPLSTPPKDPTISFISLPLHCVQDPGSSGYLLINHRPRLPDDQIGCPQTFSTFSVSPKPILRVSPSNAIDHLPQLPHPPASTAASIPHEHTSQVGQ